MISISQPSCLATHFRVCLKILAAKPKAILVWLLITSLAACGSGNSTDLAGKAQPFDLGQYKGQWLILNYWAEWCAPCRKEITELNTLNRNYENTIAVVGVNFDGVTGPRLAEQISAMGIHFPNIEQDPADILRLSRPASLPTTYIYNPAGELAFKLVGPQTEQSLLAKMDLENEKRNSKPNQEH